MNAGADISIYPYNAGRLLGDFADFSRIKRFGPKGCLNPKPPERKTTQLWP